MEKDIFNINKNQLSYGRGYVYSLQYHLVWCTKYRKKVLKDGIDLECKKMLQDLAEEYRFQILAMEVMPDHIHMLVDCRPQFYISDMIKIMKGNLARQMFLLHPELKKRTVGRTYETRLGQWKENGVLSGRPKLTCRNHAMPVFYRDVMYREGAEGKDEAYLKLYDGHDWKWFRVYLKRTDVLYETG